MGDPNASIPTPQPVKMRQMFGGKNSNSFAFVSKAAEEHGVKSQYRLSKEVAGVMKCSGITKYDMILNDALPKMEVDPETFEVRANGELLMCDPVDKVPLSQKYFLF